MVLTAAVGTRFAQGWLVGPKKVSNGWGTFGPDLTSDVTFF